MKLRIRPILAVTGAVALGVAALGVGIAAGLAPAHSRQVVVGLTHVSALGTTADATRPAPAAGSALPVLAREARSGQAQNGAAAAAPTGRSPADPSPAAPSGSPPAAGGGAVHIHACDAVPAGYVRCHAVQAVPGARAMGTGPSGYSPSDLQSAYQLPSGTAGAGQVVAVVDAYDDPRAESDLGVYRSAFGLPSCTTANGCFRKVAQDGSATYPKANGAWTQEISLDVDMVSAACPNCHIVLAEARSALVTDMLAAVDEAVTLGANEISLSWGGAEASGEARLGAHFDHPAVAITASSGDTGYGVQYPAASALVTSVGGTTLSRAPGNSRGWSETAWSGAGSGCSAFEPQPWWQAAIASLAALCSRRATADVSAVADPGTGVSVYDSVSYHGTRGWLVFGGTSVASPIIASAYALAGGVTGSPASGSLPYTHSSSLNDVTSGSNGACGSLLCMAAPGWDGPSGLGTPHGIGAF